METAPTLEMALCSQQQVEAAADPADAEGPQEADSPSPQLLPSIEGDLRQSGKVGMLSSVGGRTSYCPEYTVGVHPPLCAGFKNFKELLLRVILEYSWEPSHAFSNCDLLLRYLCCRLAL